LASLSRPPIVVIDNIDYLREASDRARAWAGLLIYQQLRRSRDPEDPLTFIVSCEDSGEFDIASESLGSRRLEPAAVVELELVPTTDHTSIRATDEPRTAAPPAPRRLLRPVRPPQQPLHHEFEPEEIPGCSPFPG
jgi:hypothetical protein